MQGSHLYDCSGCRYEGYLTGSKLNVLFIILAIPPLVAATEVTQVMQPIDPAREQCAAGRSVLRHADDRYDAAVVHHYRVQLSTYVVCGGRSAGRCTNSCVFSLTDFSRTPFSPYSSLAQHSCLTCNCSSRRMICGPVCRSLQWRCALC